MAMTQKEVERHFKALDLSTFKPGGADHFTAQEAQENPGAVLGKVCGIYQKVRPFLELASGVGLIPKKWRAALKAYIVLMDAVCPG
jgi:hypothetical protein